LALAKDINKNALNHWLHVIEQLTEKLKQNQLWMSVKVFTWITLRLKISPGIS